MELPGILFPSNPLAPRKPDFDFETEHQAALDAGFPVGILDTDSAAVIRSVPAGPALYRGWMVSADRYAQLHTALGEQGIVLLTTAGDYRFCHHLPEWYPALEALTPASAWYPQAEGWTEEALVAGLGSGPLVVKDYVKSAKHYWHEACFIPNRESIAKVTEKFLEIRGDDLEGGLVFRRFLPFAAIGEHPRSGMPMTLEYRAFFWRGRRFMYDRYWEGGEYPQEEPPWSLFEACLTPVSSPFFAMDIAQDTNGQWWVVELGDGQVSGIPPRTDAASFYLSLAEAMRQRP